VAGADWPQFRANPQLTGVAADPVPAALKLLWTYDAGELIESSAAIFGGTVYVGSRSKELLAIDLQTGKLRWKYRATDEIGESSPAVAEGAVYVGDLAGILHAVNAADGKPLWTFKTEAEIKSSPVVAGDRVLIGSYDGNLYCVSHRGGKLLWRFHSTNYVHATPAVSNGIATWRVRRGVPRHTHRRRARGGAICGRRPDCGFSGADWPGGFLRQLQ